METVRSVILVLVFAFPLLLGTFFLLAIFALLANLFRSLFWHTAPGIIASSRLVIVEKEASAEVKNSWTVVQHDADIRYEYEVDGTRYEGTNVAFQNVRAPSLSGSQQILRAYPQGQPVTVIYNPAKPSESILERRTPSGFFGSLVLAGVLFTVGLKGVLVAVGVWRFQQEDLLWLASGVAILLGAAVTWGTWRAIRIGLASRGWPTVKGVVIRSAVIMARGKVEKGTSRYIEDVAYRYEVDGNEYVSDQVSTWARDGVSRPEAERRAAVYPVGGEVQPHYNPSHPAEAVLQPGAEWLSFLMLPLGLVFLGAGIALAIWAAKG